MIERGAGQEPLDGEEAAESKELTRSCTCEMLLMSISEFTPCKEPSPLTGTVVEFKTLSNCACIFALSLSALISIFALTPSQLFIQDCFKTAH